MKAAHPSWRDAGCSDGLAFFFLNLVSALGVGWATTTDDSAVTGPIKTCSTERNAQAKVIGQRNSDAVPTGTAAARVAVMEVKKCLGTGLKCYHFRNFSTATAQQQREVVFTEMERELLVSRHEVAVRLFSRTNKLSIALIL